jgi:DNA-binding MarR family transcriptional regulator
MTKHVNRNVAISDIMQDLRKIFKSIHDYSHEVANKFGITGPQLWALKTISQNGNLSLGELSEKMYLHPSTITGIVDRLEKKGYVVRDREEKDRRVVKVQLTAKGERLVRKAPNPVQGKMIYGLRKLKKDELNSIYDSIRKLVEVIKAQNVKATFFFDQE